MDYENYIELYEAVYLFSRVNNNDNHPVLQLSDGVEIQRSGVHESAYEAIFRILVVNNLLNYEGRTFGMTKDQKDRQQYILDHMILKNRREHYIGMYSKAVDPYHYFFDRISVEEYEIYSRCDYGVTYAIGQVVCQLVDLKLGKVLELGGNSGGLGRALLSSHRACHYTVIDTEIPCKIGREMNGVNGPDITFIEGNIFELKLASEVYDSIILMNMLHDFDDGKCLDILRNCIEYCHGHTSFMIIEDVLTAEFEPKEIVMHGLRLSVECRGGKQRTKEELADLFSYIGYGLQRTIKLDSIHTLLVMGAL